MAQFLQWTITIFEDETPIIVGATFYFATFSNWMINGRLFQVTVSVLLWLEAHQPSLQIGVQIDLLLQAEDVVLDAWTPPEL